MRIVGLKSRTVRIFGDNEQNIRFDSQKNIAIFLGNNGCGKTTLLDVLSIMLSSFISSFPGQGSRFFPLMTCISKRMGNCLIFCLSKWIWKIMVGI